MPWPVATALDRTSVDVEHLEGGAGADDVDDGVERADLVEVDLAGRSAVELPLDLGQRPEDGQGPVPEPVGQSGLLDEAGDVGGGPHDGRLLGPDVDLGGGDAAPQHGLGLEGPAARPGSRRTGPGPRRGRRRRRRGHPWPCRRRSRRSSGTTPSAPGRLPGRRSSRQEVPVRRSVADGRACAARPQRRRIRCRCRPR